MHLQLLMTCPRKSLGSRHGEEITSYSILSKDARAGDSRLVHSVNFGEVQLLCVKVQVCSKYFRNHMFGVNNQHVFASLLKGSHVLFCSVMFDIIEFSDKSSRLLFINR